MTDERGVRELWKDSPWTIKAYAALEVASILFSIATSSLRTDSGVRTRSSPLSIVIWLLIAGALIYWLLRGSRATRVLLVVWNALSLIAAFGMLFAPPNGYALAAVWTVIVVINLVLLMHPLTRSWCDRRLKLTDPDRLSRSGGT